MIKIKFLEAQEVEDGEGIVIERWRAGQVVELNNASARFWLNRGLALDVQAVAREAREAKEAEAKGAEASEEPVVETEADASEPEAVEEKPEPATAAANPTSRGSGKGKRSSASRPAQA